jgi:hypothetical protein
MELESAENQRAAQLLRTSAVWRRCPTHASLARRPKRHVPSLHLEPNEEGLVCSVSPRAPTDTPRFRLQIQLLPDTHFRPT